MLHRTGSPVRLHGKGLFPMAGEYTGQIMLDGIAGFLKDTAPQLLPGQVIAPNAPPPAETRPTDCGRFHVALSTATLEPDASAAG